MEQPGKWAIIYEGSNPYGLVRNLNAGTVTRPPGRWEFVCRKGISYARYLGPSE